MWFIIAKLKIKENDVYIQEHWKGITKKHGHIIQKDHDLKQ